MAVSEQNARRNQPECNTPPLERGAVALETLLLAKHVAYQCLVLRRFLWSIMSRFLVRFASKQGVSMRGFSYLPGFVEITGAK